MTTQPTRIEQYPPRRCSTCIHWCPVTDFDGWIPDGYQACKRQFPEVKADGREVVAQTVWLEDDHIDPRCELLTGPEFGCIHHLTSNARGESASPRKETNA